MADPQLEDLVARARALREQRARERAAYQQVKGAEKLNDALGTAGTNLGNLLADEAVGDTDLGGLAPLLDRGAAVPDADMRQRLREHANVSGGASVSMPGTELSKDIEGARRGTEGVDWQEVVSQDQRLVIDPITGLPKATRDEEPSLRAHAGALIGGETGEASKIGLAVNALRSLSRGAATAANYAVAPDRIDSITDLPGDVLRGIGGEPERSVGEGGLVAKRAGGFGDTLRLRGEQLNERGTVGTGDLDPGMGVGDYVLPTIAQLVGAMGGVPGMLGAGALTRSWLSDSERPHAPTTKDLLAPTGFPTEVIDPWMTGWGHAKAGVKTAIGKVGHAILDHKDHGEDRRTYTTGAEETQKLAEQYGTDRELPKDMNDNMYDAYGEALSTMYDPLNLIPVEKLVGAVPVVGKHLTKPIRWPSRENSLARQMGKHEGAEAGLHNAEEYIGALTTVNSRQAAEAGTQQSLINEGRAMVTREEEPLVRAVLEPNTQGIPLLKERPVQDVVNDVLTAAQANVDGLAARRVMEIAKAGPQGVADMRASLAQDLGVDVFEPHPWMTGTPDEQRLLEAAKKLRIAQNRTLQADQRLGNMGRSVNGDGFMPHPDRPTRAARIAEKGYPRLADFVEKMGMGGKKLPYDARAPREMVRSGDIDTVRRAASATAEVARNGSLPTTLTPDDIDFLDTFAASPSLQKMKPMVEQARQLIQAQGVAVPKPTGNVDEAIRVAKLRNATGRASNVEVPWTPSTDPFRNVAAYRNSMAPMQATRELEQAVLGLKDINSKPIVQTLEDAVRAPRYGDVDYLLVQKLDEFTRSMPNGGTHVDDRVINDINRHLKPKGLTYVDHAVSQFMPDLSGKVIPTAIYKDLLKTAPRLDPGVIERAANMLAKFNHVWVPAVLNTPGFHIRNAFFGTFQVHLAIGGDILDDRLWRISRQVAQAAEKGGLAKGTVEYLGKKYRIADLVDEAIQNGVYEGGRFADLEGAYMRGNAGTPRKASFLKNPAGAAGDWASDIGRRINPISDKSLITKAAQQLPVVGKHIPDEPVAKLLAARGPMGGPTAENVQRMMIYVTRRIKHGATPKEAAKDVVKYMFDYTGAHLGAWEKQARRFMPFYQWMKQSLFLTLEQMLKKPQRYGQVNHLYSTLEAFSRSSNQDPRDSSPFLATRGAIPAPFSEDTPESRTFMAMERPGTQDSWLMEPILRGDPAGVGKALGQQLQPIPSMAIERVTGEYLFGDQPIDPYHANETGTLPERLAGQTSENIPGYLSRKLLGGYSALLAESTMGDIMGPEYANNDPRWTAMDESARLMSRLGSMMLGPQVSTMRPLDAKAQKVRRAKELADKARGRAQRKKKREAAQ